MTPLLCLPPVLLDQSFPRDDNELCNALDALSQIQELMEKAAIGLIMTDFLRLMTDPESFDYSRYDECPQLRDILNLIQQWILQPHEGIETIDVSRVQDKAYQPHPAPQGSEGRGFIEIWQDEVGRILFVHNRVCERGEFFIGVACDSAFAGGPLGEYNNPDRRRCFPLVGPCDIAHLSDAYEWNVPNDVIRKSIRHYRGSFFARAKTPRTPSFCLSSLRLCAFA